MLSANSKKAKVPLNTGDRDALGYVATMYDAAMTFYKEKHTLRAMEFRGKAAARLIRWSRERFPRLDDDDVLVGLAHPKVPPLFDSDYSFRKFGVIGQIEQAKAHVDKVLKRGWL